MVAEFGFLHVLVNNAAIFVLKGIEASVEDWQRLLAVNVVGPALMAKHAVPHIRRAGGGDRERGLSLELHRAEGDAHVQRLQGRDR